MKTAGILLPVTSLPSKYGIGCFSKEAYKFVDMLSNCGQQYWQILPLGPTGYGDSPYQSFSTFAGNPYLISLEDLTDTGVLTQAECDAEDFGTDVRYIDYRLLYENRIRLLKKAYKRSNIAEDKDFKIFSVENSRWLNEYALFMVVKDSFDGKPWTQWPEDIRLRKPEALDDYTNKLSDEIEFYKYIQFMFYMQWGKLKSYANSCNVKIIGDIPIYTAMDSSDVWSAPELFQLDENNTPIAVAGCPPDGFSALGQLWGNPLYNWEYHKETGYSWWTERLRHCFEMYDVVRIDHFRGFDEYYSIPYGEENAVNGHWEKGPGMDLFDKIKEQLGQRDIIAEDLGYMTDSVRALVEKTGFPNMKVLEFAFDERDTGCRNDYLPHNYGANCVAYTGTHDNQTIRSWFDTITDSEQEKAREYLCDYYTPSDKLNLPFISLIMRSPAKSCIIPLQDYMGLGDEARINTPSTVGTNWRWRVREDELSDELCSIITNMTIRYGREVRK